MTDFATLKARIADELSRSDIDSQIENHVLDAIKRYRTKPWFFGQTEATLTTAPNDRDYAVPGDFLAVETLKVTFNNDDYLLHPRSLAWINNLSTDVTGQPNIYALYREQLRLYPIPDDTYTLTLSYLFFATTPSADTDETEWTGDAEELIRASACRTLCLTVLRDLQYARMWGEVEAGALQALDRRNALSTTTGTLHPSGF